MTIEQVLSTPVAILAALVAFGCVLAMIRAAFKE